MKKLFLSFSLIIAFTFYTILYQKNLAMRSVSGVADYATNGFPAATAPYAPAPEAVNTRNNTASKNAPAQQRQTAPVSSPPPAPTPMPMPQMMAHSSPYRDGVFTGDSTDAYYGNIQVQTTIQNGRLTDVQFLDYPQDRSTSRYINGQAMPLLKQEALQAQSALVDGVSGATDTSMAFRQSLSSALALAKQ